MEVEDVEYGPPVHINCLCPLGPLQPDPGCITFTVQWNAAVSPQSYDLVGLTVT